MIQLLTTVFDTNMQEFALEASRRKYYKTRRVSELKPGDLCSIWCEDWDSLDKTELREKYEKAFGGGQT